MLGKSAFYFSCHPMNNVLGMSMLMLICFNLYPEDSKCERTSSRSSLIFKLSWWLFFWQFWNFLIYNVEYSTIALFLPIVAVHSVGRTMTFDIMAVFSSIALFMIIAVTCQACPTVERLGATTFISACAVQYQQKPSNFGILDVCSISSWLFLHWLLLNAVVMLAWDMRTAWFYSYKITVFQQWCCRYCVTRILFIGVLKQC